MTLRVLGAGGYLPKKVLTNDELAKQVQTSDQWILERTGISQRHIASQDETCSFMSFQAAARALKNSNLKAQDVDMIIVASTTPDKTFPSIACNVQSMLGCHNIPAFDVQAVCAGFIYALSLASSLLDSKLYKNILLIGAEKMSSIIDWQDRTTCILFGDGAGAAVVNKDNQGQSKVIIDSLIHAKGSFGHILYTSAGGITPSLTNIIKMDGREVFKQAIQKMFEVSQELLMRNNLTVNDIDYLVPHQANIRIINAIGQKIEIDDKKIIKTINKHANCSAASIPLALDHLLNNSKENQIKDKLIMTVGFGAGITWGANLMYI